MPPKKTDKHISAAMPISMIETMEIAAKRLDVTRSAFVRLAVEAALTSVGMEQLATTLKSADA
jgi:hypothetical protein|tara:strand:+ start:301 stop:489 length:189 start_codon:yes stop_codon:yes gene_type:complete